MMSIIKRVGMTAFPILLCALLLAGCARHETFEPKSVADLSGRSVGVQTGTLYEEELLKSQSDIHFEYFTDGNGMIIACESGKLDAMLIEETTLEVIRQYHPSFRAMEEPISLCDICIGVGDVPNSAILFQQLNEFIQTCKENGVSREMKDYWIDHYDPDKCTTDKSGITGENGKLYCALEGSYEPFSYLGNGELQGFDIDFLYRFCRAYGYEPEISNVSYDAIASALASGKCDIGLNIVPGGEREVLLTDPYFTLDILLAYCAEEPQANFFQSLGDQFQKTFIKEKRYQQFLQGLGCTVLICLSAIVLGTALGFAIYLPYRKGNRALRFIVTHGSGLLQNLPTVILLMVLYYIVFGSLRISGTAVAIITFTLLFACSVTGMLESGEKAVGDGQLEAALSQGFSPAAAFFEIVLPQAAMHFLPSFKSEIVSLMKESSIVGYIAVQDLTKISDMVRSRTYDAFFSLLATALIYFALAKGVTGLLERIEINIDPTRRSEKRILRGITPRKGA